MPAWNNNMKFKALEKKWYEKLRKTGFKDIENRPHELHQETAKFLDKEAIEEYYSKVSEYLYSGDFKNYKEKAIWFLHTEGLSYREISSIIRVAKTQIAKVIISHIKAMKVNVIL